MKNPPVELAEGLPDARRSTAISDYISLTKPRLNLLVVLTLSLIHISEPTRPY